MALLILFGFIAGAATALSPCVLPILPVALSAGASGGRRRPAGIVTGMAASFTFATVALVYVIDALGLPNNLLRDLAIAVLMVFGLSLLVPAASARIEAWLSRLSGRAGVFSGGSGFWSGTLVGSSLGLVYAPCAGPILAGVITVSASQPFTAGRLAVALSYGVGSAVVLYALMLGGRRLTARLTPKVPKLQVAMGAVMILFALGMLAEYDLRFQSAIASDLPAILVNPSKDLESTDAASDALADIGGAEVNERAERIARNVREIQQGEEPPANDLPVVARAPDFTDTQMWFNTPGNRALSMEELRGRVVLVDFWTYSCINCIRTQPYLTAWDETYRDDGLTIVGVHTPEFPFERDAQNVKEAIERAGIEYPVVQDNEYGTWNAYANRYWPAEYFIDASGRIRYTHFGEGAYERKEEVIRELLAEAGRDPDGSGSVDGERISEGVTTPESYLGAARAVRFTDGFILPGLHDYGEAGTPPPEHLSYGGRWRIHPDFAVAAGPASSGEIGTGGDASEIALNFQARRVFLVLGSPGRPRRVRLTLDGEPIPPRAAGRDVRTGSATATVADQRLYRLVDLPEVGRHILRLHLEPGVEAYAFTFG